MPSKEQKWTLVLLRLLSVLYAFLYPFTFQMILMCLVMSRAAQLLPTVAFYSIVALALAVPVMMVISIWKMWEHYVKANYKRARWYSVIPFIIVGLLISTFIPFR